MDDIRATWLRGLPEAGEIARRTDTLTVTAKYRERDAGAGRRVPPQMGNVPRRRGNTTESNYHGGERRGRKAGQWILRRWKHG